jgi:hypothetical protein
MKVLIDKNTREAKYLFEDDALVEIYDHATLAPDLMISFMTKKNSLLIENVVSPEDFQMNKYLFTDKWENNPRWAAMYADWLEVQPAEAP